MKKILDQVLEKIRPSDNEIRKIDEICNSLSNKVTKKGLKPLIVGSITMLLTKRIQQPRQC